MYMCVSPVSWMSTSLSSGVIIDNAGGLYSNVMCSLIHQLPVLTLHTTQILNSTHATHNTNTELNSRYTQHKYWTQLTLHTTQTLNSTHTTHNTNIELNSRYTQHKHWTQLTLHTTQTLNSTHATHNTNIELNSCYTQHKHWTQLTLHTTQTLNSTQFFRFLTRREMPCQEYDHFLDTASSRHAKNRKNWVPASSDEGFW